MLPEILCSSVIRASNRGDSHGGIYWVDCETGRFKCLLDWNKPITNWDIRGGDRGVRGMKVFDDKLYTLAGNALFVFNKKMELIKEVSCPALQHTHEMDVDEYGTLYCVANLYDSIILYDIYQDKFTIGYHIQKGNRVSKFNPYNINDNNYPKPSDIFHLNSVKYDNGKIYLSGNQVDNLYVFYKDGVEEFYLHKICKEPHTALPYENGVVWNHSMSGNTYYKNENGEIKTYPTPKLKDEEMSYSHLTQKDHCRQGYTRGMVITYNHFIVGTSPARILCFEQETQNLDRNIILTNDMRNSICGICLNKGFYDD